MTTDALALAGGAFVAGLLGGGHCIGMCGPLVTALGLAAAKRGGVLFHLLYNAGRILTYTLIGVLAGAVGAFVEGPALKSAGKWVMVFGDVFVILVGLGSAGLLRWLDATSLEAAAPVGLLTRITARLRRLPAALAALPLGLVMGLLPCGFLYVMGVAAALSTDALTGGLVLLAFGVGTAPALLLVAGATHLWGAKARRTMVRVAGVVIVLLGAWNLVQRGLRWGWW